MGTQNQKEGITNLFSLIAFRCLPAKTGFSISKQSAQISETVIKTITGLSEFLFLLNIYI